ncbi:MAG: hypothetical protein GX796_11215 [Clostridiaceae bacterium]|nr:hypothetical protein [Clostridiaceae bacterium]
MWTFIWLVGLLGEVSTAIAVIVMAFKKHPKAKEGCGSHAGVFGYSYCWIIL